ncbi:aKG-HExxH-type peptide beta-hydroxylase [Cystobacter ferrugineus]|nr:HEXXH motif-containing putative peptide modification protein [Cystobacter ferrugineus]
MSERLRGQGEEAALQEAIRTADRELTRHPVFGDSKRISALVLERYKFGLELFAERLPAVAALLPRLTEGGDARARRLYRDPLVRKVMEAAFKKLEQGALAAPQTELEELLALAAEALERTDVDGPCEARMSRRFRVGPRQDIWVWNFAHAEDPILRELREGFDRVYSSRGTRPGRIIQPEEEQVARLDRACSLLTRVLPEVGPSALGHISSICLLEVEVEGGKMMSASGGDGIPSTVFMSPEQLRNPWDAAGHLLHEGLHLKLFDVVRAHTLVAPHSGPLEIPWRNIPWSMVRAVFAFHVYAHIELYRAAADLADPVLLREFGEPGSYTDNRHAMSVSRNNRSVPYGLSVERTRFLGKHLRTTWAPWLTPEGLHLTRWLQQCMAPFVDWDA